MGDMYATSKPAEVRTLLDSCVFVCLYDPEAGIGGMNYILIPYFIGIRTARNR